MPYRTVKRAAGVLLATGLIDGAITIARLAEATRYGAALDGIAIAAGGFLLIGGPRAALWVRTLAVFMLSGCIVLVIAAPLFQPLDLTLTEIRLDPADLAGKAAMAAAVLCITLWITWQLGRPSVRAAIVASSIRRWDMRIPAQAGGGLVALAGLMLWLTLHGQSADAATSLALQQLGPDYRYHLSWISKGDYGHGTTVTGVVTAWNKTEVKKILLQWQTR